MFIHDGDALFAIGEEIDVVPFEALDPGHGTAYQVPCDVQCWSIHPHIPLLAWAIPLHREREDLFPEEQQNQTIIGWRTRSSAGSTVLHDLCRQLTVTATGLILIKGERTWGILEGQVMLLA